MQLNHRMLHKSGSLGSDNFILKVMPIKAIIKE